MKYKIGTDLYIEFVPKGDGHPEFIEIDIENSFSHSSGIVIWTKDEAFKLAYKLMSLASEME